MRPSLLRRSRANARIQDGAVIMAYGSFLSKSLNFIAIALSLFGIAKMYEVVTKDKVVKRTVKCRYCRKRISEKVSSFPSLSLVWNLLSWTLESGDWRLGGNGLSGWHSK